MGETIMENDNNIWTLKAYIEHTKALADIEAKFQNERDRRYTEVDIEKQKALRIKETADLAALSLARESQVYKDQQADVMREKNLAASGIYATNADLQNVIQQMSSQQQTFADKIEKTLSPLIDFVNQQKGTTVGTQLSAGKIYSTIAAVAAVFGMVIYFTK